MNVPQYLEPEKWDGMTRLAVCVVIAVAAVYAAQKLFQGKNIPLWEKYGPWLLDNKVQAIAVAAAVLYGLSLALWPEKGGAAPFEEDGFSPCTGED